MTNSLLSSITKPQARPAIITITGDPGVGKTVLAATFPKPIFIRAEDGMESISLDKRPDAFPVLDSVGALWQQLKTLIDEDHGYKTLIIDSVTQLETMFAEHIMDTDPKKPKSLAQANGGYGAGYSAVSALHGRVRKAAKILNERKGMFVIFIAHSETSTIELPDQDPYSRYDLRLHKKSVPHYADNVDMVAYLRLETFTTGDGERKKAISSGQRIAVCHTDAAQISKNRYGITEPVNVNEGVNPFIEFIPALTPTTKTNLNKEEGK